MTADLAALLDRETWYGSSRYRVVIQKRQRRGRLQYRWVLERHFAYWRDERNGLWTRSLDRAVARGNRVLNRYDDDRYEEGADA